MKHNPPDTAKLWHRCLHEGVKDDGYWSLPVDPLDRGQWPGIHKEGSAIGFIATSPVIIVPPSEIHGMGPHTVQFTSYKNLSIPFSRFWLDCENFASRKGQAAIKRACQIMDERSTYPVDLRTRYDHWASGNAAKMTSNQLIRCSDGILGGMVVEADQQDDGGWILRGLCIAAIAESRPALLCDVTIPLNATGTPQFPLYGFESAKVHATPWFSDSQSADSVERTGRSFIELMLDSLELLSCKNVDLLAKPMASRDSRIASKRHGEQVSGGGSGGSGGSGGYRYHVLTVRGPGTANSVKPIEISGPSSNSVALHMCRGHYSEYGAEYGKGLLFGKFSGRFYVPPHMKGSRDKGVVEKDYQVSPD